MIDSVWSLYLQRVMEDPGTLSFLEVSLQFSFVWRSQVRICNQLLGFCLFAGANPQFISLSVVSNCFELNVVSVPCYLIVFRRLIS